jgi:flagellar motility protein MotE (MotC chaperone)
MAQEEEAIRAKEQDDETSELYHNSVQTSSLPPKLNFRRLESIQRLLQYGAALTLLVFLGLIVFSYFEWRETVEEIKTNSQKIEEQNETLLRKQAALDQSQIDLNQSNENLARQQEELTRQREEVKMNEETIKKQKEEVIEQQKLIEGLKGVLETKILQNGSDKQIPPLIYVHIAREDQRGRAADIVRQLKNKGYIMPGIENVHSKAPPTISELRRCGEGDVAQNDLKEITKALESLSVPVTQKLLTKCGNVRARLYELWFADNF